MYTDDNMKNYSKDNIYIYIYIFHSIVLSNSSSRGSRRELPNNSGTLVWDSDIGSSLYFSTIRLGWKFIW
jgi:hypothetical protein